MKAEGNKVKQSVTTIQEDGFIYIAEGIAEYEIGTTDFDALDGKTVRLELLGHGCAHLGGASNRNLKVHDLSGYQRIACYLFVTCQSQLPSSRISY